MTLNTKPVVCPFPCSSFPLRVSPGLEKRFRQRRKEDCSLGGEQNEQIKQRGPWQRETAFIALLHARLPPASSRYVRGRAGNVPQSERRGKDSLFANTDRALSFYTAVVLSFLSDSSTRDQTKETERTRD